MYLARTRKSNFSAFSLYAGEEVAEKTKRSNVPLSLMMEPPHDVNNDIYNPKKTVRVPKDAEKAQIVRYDRWVKEEDNGKNNHSLNYSN